MEPSVPALLHGLGDVIIKLLVGTLVCVVIGGYLPFLC
jgi:hypothetical protein